jgi:hypothetical protein
MKVLRNIVILAAVATLAQGCIRDDVDAYTPDDGTVLIQLKMPETGSQTRVAVDPSDEEYTIDHLDVLVFDDKGGDADTFLYATTPTDEITDGPDYPFTRTYVLPIRRSQAGEKQKLVLIANLKTEVEALIAAELSGEDATTKTKGDLLAKLTFEDRFSGWESYATPLPMWGESPVSSLITATSTGSAFGNIDMLFSVAKIEVGINGNADFSEVNPFNNLFVLGNVAVANRVKFGYAAPQAGAGYANNKVSAPSVPTTNEVIAGPKQILSTTSFNYKIGHASFYVQEVDNSARNNDEGMFLLLSGYYTAPGASQNSSVLTWYRVDFYNRSADDPQVAKLDILRGHRYMINITGVDGPGYPTAEEAAKSYTSKMNATVIPWNQWAGEIDPAGEYSLDVSQSEWTFDGLARTDTSTDNKVTIWTDHPDGWSASITGNTGSAISWLTLSATSGEAGETATVSINPAANTSRASRYGRITVTAGKWSYVINVTQDEVPGVRAVPGVIGYYANGFRKGELTLDGDDGDDRDIVYVAYFKFGSLIAVGARNYGKGTFTSADIVAVPEKTDGGFPYTLEEYKAYITGDRGTAWGQINDAGDAGINLNIRGGNITTLLGDQYVAAGIGDPCVYYFGDKGYRLPTTRDVYGFVGGFPNWLTQDAAPNNARGLAESTYNFYDREGTHAGTANDPHTGNFPVDLQGDVLYQPAYSQMLPAAGNRQNTGNFSGHPSIGNYWTSTLWGGGIGYFMAFDGASVQPDQNMAFEIGMTVRCVQPAPTISVTPEEYTFAAAGGTKNDFAVTTTNFTGTPSVTKVGDSSDTSAAWITTASVSGTASPYTLTVTAAPNSATTTRTATITLAAGTATATVTITQAPTPETEETLPTADLLSTVGAFWKKDQTGERIVTIPTTSSTYAGAWTAQIVYYGTGFSAGDILMVAGDSEDATSIAANTYTNPESRQVSAYPTAAQAIAGTATTASGIKFRIFMGDTWDGTSPRYAKIAVNFGSTGQYTRFIYVRQGEQADYLMTRDDAGTYLTAANGFTRPYAAKFSPYNLTAPEFNGDGSQTQRGASTAARSGVMTDYPSQAGAFYKWAEDAGVVAYNPAMPNSAAVTGWVSSNNVTEWWDQGTTGNTIRDLSEGCPTGYRRPTDGSTSAGVAIEPNTEFAHSIYSNPPINTSSYLGNSVWGYYSDGWFDRFALGTQTNYSGGTANTAVSTDKSTVAYVGRLFYNPVAASDNYNASLFFPAPGYRNASNGYLYYSGANGFYWSSSATSDSDGVYLCISSSTAFRGNYDHYVGFSVRCVVAE